MQPIILKIFYRSSTWRNVACSIFLIVTLFTYLSYRELNQPNFFLYDDNANFFLPYYVYNWRTIVQHRTIPLINWHQFLGQTYLAQGQSSVLYPPVYLAVGLSSLLFNNYFSSIDILVFFHLLVSVVATFYLLRRLQVSTSISTLSALLWITMPMLTTISRAWVNFSYLAAYLPLNFIALEYFLKKPSLKKAVILAIIKSLLFYQGYVQHEFIVVVAEITFFLAFIISHLKKLHSSDIVRLCSYLTLSYFFLFFLIAPQLLPMILAQQESQFRNQPTIFWEFIYGHITPGLFVQAQKFVFLPRTMHSANSHLIYTGPFVLAFLCLALIERFRKKLGAGNATCYFFVAGTFLLLTSDLYGLLYSVPFFNLFRWPLKYYPVFLFFTVISLAQILQVLTSNHRPSGRAAIHALLILSVFLNIQVSRHATSEVFGPWSINQPPFIDHLTQINKDLGRVFTYQVNDITKYHYPYLGFNYSTLFNQYHFGGYDVFVSKLNHQLSLQLNYASSYQLPINREVLNHLSQWSTKYIITYNNEQLKKDLLSYNLEILYESDQLAVFDNKQSLPYVYSTTDPATTIPFQFYPNSIDIFPTNKMSHEITVTVAPLPQFHILADNKLIGKVKSDNGPIKITVPSYTHKITIRYIDYPFIAGCTLFAVFWILLIMTWNTRKILSNTQDHQVTQRNHKFNQSSS